MITHYQISHINENDRWIFVSAEETDCLDAAPFIKLVKVAVANVGGEITLAGYCQYRISNLPLDILFQWDDLFGIVVVFGSETKKNEAVSFLKHLFQQMEKGVPL